MRRPNRLPDYTLNNPVITGDMFFGDDQKLYFGDANDSYLSYDGSNLIINPKSVGTGKVEVIGAIKVNHVLAGTNYGLITATDGKLDVGSKGVANILTFSTGATPTERMRITHDGKVGIGKTPAATLDVVGNAAFTSSVGLDAGAGDSPALALADGDDNYLQVQKKDAGNAIIVNNEGSIDIKPSGDTNDYFEFSTSASAPTFKMLSNAGAQNTTLTVDTGGDLTVTPSGGDANFVAAQVKVDSSANATLVLEDGDNNNITIQKLDAGTGSISCSEGNLSITAAGGTIDFSGDHLTTTGDITSVANINWTGLQTASGAIAPCIDLQALANNTDNIIFTASAQAPGDPINITGWWQCQTAGASCYIPYYV